MLDYVGGLVRLAWSSKYAGLCWRLGLVGILILLRFTRTTRKNNKMKERKTEKERKACRTGLKFPLVLLHQLTAEEGSIRFSDGPSRL